MLFPCVGKVKCWGRNHQGQLSRGNILNVGTSASHLGTNLPFMALIDVRRVDCSSTQTSILTEEFGETCARMQTGGIKCWGIDSHGQSGYGDFSARGDGALSMGDRLPEVNFGNNYVISMNTATQSRCVLLDNGELKCYGNNGSSRLGIGSTLSYQQIPTTVLLGTGTAKVKQVSMTDNGGGVLFGDGTIKVWGQASTSRGYGDTAARGGTILSMGDNLPFISFVPPVVALHAVAESDSQCAVLSDGRVKCWGMNSYGQLARGDTTATVVKAPLEPFSDLGTTERCFRCGNGHCCMLFPCVGKVKCWGRNHQGQLGLNDKINRGSSTSQMGADLP
ncbi:regulator of chromosome condensation 1/beta-lactamase-inhibitor protein II, partial [Baffinella frigidus]